MSASKPSQNTSQEVIFPNPEATSSSSLYPSMDVKELAENLFPAVDDDVSQGSSHLLQPSEDVLVKVPGALVHLIEKDHSVELACGELEIVSLRQGDNVIAVLARVGDDIQWPLAKDEAAVKLDEVHYFFTLRVPPDGSVGTDGDDEGKECEMLNYGLTIASKGQEALLKELDRVLEMYSCFSVQKMGEIGSWEVLDGSVAREMSPAELESKENKELMGESSAAYWTTLAPNVEDYSGHVARLIAAGSGQLIRGILWCGDVTVDRLKWGNEFFLIRMEQISNSEISPSVMKRIQRVKKLTKMSEKMASGVLSGVVKVSGFFTSSIVNSKVGKKFFSLLPGEIVLASLDGFSKFTLLHLFFQSVQYVTLIVCIYSYLFLHFSSQKLEKTSPRARGRGCRPLFFLLNMGKLPLSKLELPLGCTTTYVLNLHKATTVHIGKVFDAVELAGRNVMSTTSVVTTGLVSRRYGEQAAQATNEGLDAAGHAIGAAWAVFKIRKAINPKSVLKPTTLAKAAASANSDELKTKYKK